MQDADQGATAGGGYTARSDGRDLRIGIVQARFNATITDALASACLGELAELGVGAKHIKHVTVPGTLEVALALHALAESEAYDALIALGCIIRGETYHFELVLSLDHGIPIANAVLTVENEEQAWARATDKGRDAARVAVEMANLMEDLS